MTQTVVKYGRNIFKLADVCRLGLDHGSNCHDLIQRHIHTLCCCIIVIVDLTLGILQHLIDNRDLVGILVNIICVWEQISLQPIFTIRVIRQLPQKAEFFGIIWILVDCLNIFLPLAHTFFIDQIINNAINIIPFRDGDHNLFTGCRSAQMVKCTQKLTVIELCTDAVCTGFRFKFHIAQRCIKTKQ